MGPAAKDLCGIPHYLDVIHMKQKSTSQQEYKPLHILREKQEKFRKKNFKPPPPRNKFFDPLPFSFMNLWPVRLLLAIVGFFIAVGLLVFLVLFIKTLAPFLMADLNHLRGKKYIFSPLLNPRRIVVL